MDSFDEFMYQKGRLLDLKMAYYICNNTFPKRLPDEDDDEYRERIKKELLA